MSARCGNRLPSTALVPPQWRACSTEGGEDTPDLTTVPDVNDPERPDENELARAHKWHSVLWWHWDREERLLWDRMDRVTDPELLVMTVQAFSANKASCDELFTTLEPRFIPAVPDMSAGNLSLLAWAYGRHNGAKGSDALWNTVKAAVVEGDVGPFTKKQAAALLMGYEGAGRDGGEVLGALKSKLAPEGR